MKSNCMTDAKTPKKIGRPATGRTPNKEVVAKFRQNLVDAGGTTVNVNVGPEAAHALEVIIHTDGNTPTTRGAKKAAVEAALISHARKVGKKA